MGQADRYTTAVEAIERGFTTREAAEMAQISRQALFMRRKSDAAYAQRWDAAIAANSGGKRVPRAIRDPRSARRARPVVDAQVVPVQPPKPLPADFLTEQQQAQLLKLGRIVDGKDEDGMPCEYPPGLRSKALEWQCRAVLGPTIAQLMAQAQAPQVEDAQAVTYVELPADGRAEPPDEQA